MENTYNGWTNYSTWRVNLEVFDGMDLVDYFGGGDPLFDPMMVDVGELANALKDHVEMGLGDECKFGSLAYNYALAFISDVNWYEIAQSMIDVAIENDKEQA
jgi:hypothetical protein